MAILEYGYMDGRQFSEWQATGRAIMRDKRGESCPVCVHLGGYERLSITGLGGGRYLVEKVDKREG